jgi:hypothetical protein
LAVFEKKPAAAAEGQLQAGAVLAAWNGFDTLKRNSF